VPSAATTRSVCWTDVVPVGIAREDASRAVCASVSASRCGPDAGASLRATGERKKSRDQDLGAPEAPRAVLMFLQELQETGLLAGELRVWGCGYEELRCEWEHRRSVERGELAQFLRGECCL